MVTASWLKKYPNTAAAFRRALVKAQTIATNDPAAVQRGMEAFAKVPAKVAAIEALPQYPTVMNTTLLGRLAGLMLTFNMINQKYDVGQMITK
jgi:NitT/TauT family transport system substrate-binding protein